MAADEAKVLGKGSDFEYEGKVYTTSAITYDVQCEYSSWLKRRAIMAIKEQLASGWIDAAEYERKMDRFDRNVAAGVYSFLGQISRESVQPSLTGEEGIKELTRIALRKNHPDVSDELFDKIWEHRKDVVARAMVRDNADPLLSRPPEAVPAADQQTSTPAAA